MKAHYIFIYILLGSFSLRAQSDLEIFLQQTEKNNYRLQTARALADSQTQASKTGLSPNNPQISYGYLSDGQGGKLQELEVTQSFKFPTVYIQQAKQAKNKQKLAELNYRLVRQTLLVEAQQAYLELIFMQKKLQLNTKRLEHASKLSKAIGTRFDIGDATILEKQKVNFVLLHAENQQRLIKQQIALQKEKLNMYTGGKQRFSYADEYPVFVAISVDSLWEIYTASPELQFAQTSLNSAKQQTKIAQAGWFPSFSLGYAQEKTPVENLNGLRAAVTIPLWQQRNTIKVAKAQIQYRESVWLERNKLLKLQLKQQHAALKLLAENTMRLKQSLEENNVPDYLFKALRAGEFSLIDYLNEIVFYYNKKEEWLEMQFQYNSLKAELYKVLL